VSLKSTSRQLSLDRRGLEIPEGVLSVQDLFLLAVEITEQYFKTTVEPVLLTAVVVVESSGDPVLKQWREDLQQLTFGLGQIPLSTAQALVQAGYSIFEEQDILQPRVGMYFAAAYIDFLSKQNPGVNEEVLVKAYHNGPGTSPLDSTSTSLELWRTYSQASSQLERLKTAMLCQSSDLETIHIVQRGESLNSIARICGLDPKDILQCNPDIDQTHPVESGDCIELPVETLLPRFYAVKTGDSLEGIARQHNVSTLRLIKSNIEIKSLSRLRQGWILSLPGLKGPSTSSMDTTGARNQDLVSIEVEDGPFVLSNISQGIQDEEMCRSFRQICNSNFSRDHFRPFKDTTNGKTLDAENKRTT